ncbi:MAG: hypothetical protein GY756_10010 [bacterium]|nr:hypothetical protein [bacterium]
MADSVTFKGQKAVLKALKKVANPQKLLDKDFQRIASNSLRNLKINSLSKQGGSKSFTFQGMNIQAKNLKTGLTANAWQIKRIGFSSYQATNDRKTQDKKHFIVNILNDGTRSDIYPKQKRRLYMPLSRRGQAKAPGTVDKSLKYGEDFILLKKAKKKIGSHFVDKDIKKSVVDLTKSVIATIRNVYK